MPNIYSPLDYYVLNEPLPLRRRTYEGLLEIYSLVEPELEVAPPPPAPMLEFNPLLNPLPTPELAPYEKPEIGMKVKFISKNRYSGDWFNQIGKVIRVRPMTRGRYEVLIKWREPILSTTFHMWHSETDEDAPNFRTFEVLGKKHPALKATDGQIAKMQLQIATLRARGDDKSVARACGLQRKLTAQLAMVASKDK